MLSLLVGIIIYAVAFALITCFYRGYKVKRKSLDR